ncbi:hypothetical protein ACFLQ8_03075 [Candidatus Auribacterota bacterium]
MRKSLIVGILRESKEGELRSPLSPEDVRWLIDRKIRVEVESSGDRVFSDNEYKKAGAAVLPRVNKASLLLGIKERIPGSMLENKIYMIFSHTVKGQKHNMPLLRSCLKKKITLIDYENIVNPRGKRLAYFGKFAGICGAVDSLHYFGKKLELKNIDNPFLDLRQAHTYASNRDVKKAVSRVSSRIKKSGLDKRLEPFIIGVTGHGNVLSGVDEIISRLDPVEIHPKDMREFFKKKKAGDGRIYKIVFYREEKLRSKNGSGYYFEEYLKHPDRFESNLDRYLPYLSMLIHTSYWDDRYPRLVTRRMIHSLAKKRPFRLEFIGDISCDIKGSIELTYKTSSLDDPVYTYDAVKKKYSDGCRAGGIAVLAVDNLPTQLPKDASEQFSSLIREYVYQLAAHGVRDITNHAALPLELRGAVIAEGGRLANEYEYLKRHINSTGR